MHPSRVSTVHHPNELVRLLNRDHCHWKYYLQSQVFHLPWARGARLFLLLTTTTSLMRRLHCCTYSHLLQTANNASPRSTIHDLTVCGMQTVTVVFPLNRPRRDKRITTSSSQPRYCDDVSNFRQTGIYFAASSTHVSLLDF